MSLVAHESGFESVICKGDMQRMVISNLPCCCVGIKLSPRPSLHMNTQVDMMHG